MKLASSITFPKCCRLFISDVMQVATLNLANSTTVLNLGLIPKSVEQQSFGRGNRDCSTDVFLFPIIFPDGFEHPPRLDYLLREPVPQFMLDSIDARISGCSAKTQWFLKKYTISKPTATSLFYSHAPINLLLAIHFYSRIEVSKKNKKFFKLSIDLLRAFTQACAYVSNGAFQVRRNPETVRNDTEFARLLGFFLLDVVNRIIGAPLTRSDEEWNTFFQSHVDIKKSVDEIRELILGDGLGHFRINGEPKTVTPQLLSEVLLFTRQYAPEISPFFMKEQCDKMYVMKPDEDTGKPTFGASKFCLPVCLPFQAILTGAGDVLFPMFFLEIPPVVVEKEVDVLSAGGGPAQVIPTSRPCAGGGGGPADHLSDGQLTGLVQELAISMDEIPNNVEFTAESFFNGNKYPGGVLPDIIRSSQNELKKIDKQANLLTLLVKFGLMKKGQNGRYLRDF